MKVQGTQEVVQSLEFNIDTVYVRNNIQRIETDEFTGWEYDEEQYPLRGYLSKMANESLILSEENKQLKEKIASQESVIGEIMFTVIPELNGGGI